MTWLGIDARIDLMSIVLAVILKRGVSQPFSLFLILSNKNWKSFFVGFLVIMGNPRYLPRLLVCFTARQLLSRFLLASKIVLEKVMLDLLKLMD